MLWRLGADVSLGFRGLNGIDAEFVRQLGQVDHHVPNLLPDLGQLLGNQVFALLFGKPLEVLNDLRRLDAESHRKVFRRMELLPMPFRDERAYRSP